MTVTLIGAGAQARSHLPVIAHLLPDAEVIVCDRDQGRLDALTREVQAGLGALGSFGTWRTARDPLEAVAAADLVISMVSFGPARQLIAAEAFTPGATIVAVDYDMCVPASVASEAALFLVDDREQYLANRHGTVFAGYPSEVTTMGEAVLGKVSRPAGRVVVTHLGVGLADVVFADAVLRTAAARGIGTLLDR